MMDVLPSDKTASLGRFRSSPLPEKTIAACCVASKS
jgi:hypothetical protein